MCHNKVKTWKMEKLRVCLYWDLDIVKRKFNISILPNRTSSLKIFLRAWKHSTIDRMIALHTGFNRRATRRSSYLCKEWPQCTELRVIPECHQVWPKINKNNSTTWSIFDLTRYWCFVATWQKLDAKQFIQYKSNKRIVYAC